MFGCKQRVCIFTTPIILYTIHNNSKFVYVVKMMYEVLWYKRTEFTLQRNRILLCYKFCVSVIALIAIVTINVEVVEVEMTSSKDYK